MIKVHRKDNSELYINVAHIVNVWSYEANERHRACIRYADGDVDFVTESLEEIVRLVEEDKRWTVLS